MGGDDDEAVATRQSEGWLRYTRKTTIAAELVYSFQRTGTPCAFVDLDGQGGASHETATPEAAADAEVCVIDTPGSLQAKMGEWMSQADLIIMPTRPSGRDIPPLSRVQQLARTVAPGVPILYIINGWTRYRVARDFETWLRSSIADGAVEIVRLPQSEQFPQAFLADMSVVEYGRRNPAAVATLEMVNTVRRLVGLPLENPASVLGKMGLFSLLQV